MNTFTLTTFPNLKISISKRFNMKKEWEMMAPPSLVLFSCRLAPFLGDKLEWKQLSAGFSVQITRCSIIDWQSALLQCDPAFGVRRSWARKRCPFPGWGWSSAPGIYHSPFQGKPWHCPLLPFAPWLLCGKSGHAGQGKARKHSCHILVRPKNCRLHCSTDLYNPGSAASPRVAFWSRQGFHSNRSLLHGYLKTWKALLEFNPVICL